MSSLPGWSTLLHPVSISRCLENGLVKMRSECRHSVGIARTRLPAVWYDCLQFGHNRLKLAMRTTSNCPFQVCRKTCGNVLSCEFARVAYTSTCQLNLKSKVSIGTITHHLPQIQPSHTLGRAAWMPSWSGPLMTRISMFVRNVDHRLKAVEMYGLRQESFILSMPEGVELAFIENRDPRKKVPRHRIPRGSSSSC